MTTQNQKAAYFSIGASVAAGVTQDIAITGSYVACLSCNLPTFKLGLDGAPPQFFAQGMKLKAPFGGTFGIVTVDNTGGASVLNVSLAVGIGDIVDGRFPAGDPLDVASLNGNAFGGIANPNPVAAQFMMVGVQNPVTSTKTGVIRALEIEALAAVTVLLMPYTANGGAGGLQGPKFIGGAAPTLKMDASNSATQNLNGSPLSGLKGYALQANTPWSVPLRGGLVLPPNTRVGFFAQTVNIGLILNAEWEEK
jgi:hypothetical protein